jgi:HlyD family secretion protein
MEPASVQQSPGVKTNVARKSNWSGLRWLIVGVIILAAGGIGAFYWSRPGRGESKREGGAASQTRRAASQFPSVLVMKPQQGGMERTTDQPGTIRAFEFAPLYAKVSGYLKELKVDRGDRVKNGQLLAQVFDPELDVAVLQAEAALEHSKAAAKQAEARLKTAKVGVQAAEAKRNQAKSVLEEAQSQRTYRRKVRDRISALVLRNAAEPQLADEKEDEYMASLAAEHSAEAGIETAEAQFQEAKAAVEQAEADLATAKTEITVSEANLKKAKVFVDYTRIESPLDGVVTFRGEGVHPGAFIRSAMEGGNAEPLLTVGRTDRFRTIVQVPERDVPFCDQGDPATVTFDALKGRVFKGTVSRVASSEDLVQRIMRVEIDLPNKDGLLRDGMYGRAVIELEPPSKNLTIPASCLIEQNGEGEGAVYLVKDGKVKRAPIRVGKDNGLQVEVLSGLSPDDEIIAQPTSSIAEGIDVKAELTGRSAEKASTE